MDKVTCEFNQEKKVRYPKEDIEWLRLWCEDVNDDSLPHVALIGDSITEGYYTAVKSALKDVAKVDYLATSYSIASEMYNETIKNFVNDSKYDVIHFNYGLHASGVEPRIYEIRCRQLLKQMTVQSKVIVATTTTILDTNLQKEHDFCRDKIITRNEIIVALAKEFWLEVDDLNTLCKTFDVSMRNSDGVHFNETGYMVLAKSVTQSIQKQLERD